MLLEPWIRLSHPVWSTGRGSGTTPPGAGWAGLVGTLALKEKMYKIVKLLRNSLTIITTQFTQQNIPKGATTKTFSLVTLSKLFRFVWFGRVTCVVS